MSAPATDPMIGRLIDSRYLVRSRIARGGMATVYLATDQRLQRQVAVKVMHGHLADDSQFKKRFIQEALSAARIAHPNVVNVYDQGQDADSAYLVMEYLPGITLRQLLDEYGTLTAQQAIDITDAILNGLSAAHRAGIIHRDLKPENVLLADDGRIKIGDFGLARAATAPTATGSQLLGTIAYLAPELLTRGVADARSDVYAVGIMLFEMLTGEQPFTGDEPMQIAYRHTTEDLPPPSSRAPAVPRELDELVLWATTKDPAQRPADARALLEQLRDAEDSLALPDRADAAATAVIPDLDAGRRDRDVTQAVPSPGPGAAAAPVTDELRFTDPLTRPRTRGTDPRPPIGLPEPETRVLSRRDAALVPVAAAPPPPGRGRRRVLALIAAVLALALAGGGIAYWFTLGPGGQVVIPQDLAGRSVDDARAILERLELDVAEQTRDAYSPDIPVGDVAETDPALGTSVAKGSPVVILVSVGPEPIEIAFEAGMPRADAEQIVADDFTLAGVDERFTGSVAAGLLIDARGADGESLLEADTYGDQQPITLIVSAGPLPDVAGRSVADATSRLDAVRLSVDSALAREEFSDSVAEGDVVGIVPVSGPIRPGDSVGLILSKGPPPVDVPNIVGMTWTEAAAALDAAGLRFAFDREIDEELADRFPDDARVTRCEPGEDEVVTSGTVITVRLGI